MPRCNLRRYVTRLSALLLIALCLTGCRAEADTWEQIKASGVMRIGIDPTFPPFAEAEGDRVWGLDVDLANSLAEGLGLEARFTYFGYDGLYDALATHQVDVLISALVIAPERTQDVAYTRPYFDAGQILIRPGTRTDIGRLSDMAGKDLAVELGSLGHVEALERQRDMVDLTIRPYNSVSDAIRAVEAGIADAALVDGVSGRLYLKAMPDKNRSLIRLPELVTLEPYAVAVRIEDERLLEELDFQLQELSESGALEAMIVRHLGP